MHFVPTRRQFVGLAASAGVSIAWRAVWAQGGDEDSAIAVLGDVKALNEKEPVFVTAKYTDKDGITVAERKVVVIWQDGGKSGNIWRVLSSICTHLKCKIGYSSERRIFVCPCHKSEYDLTGKVIKKPAKKDLADYSRDAFEEGGKLKLKFSS